MMLKSRVFKKITCLFLASTISFNGMILSGLTASADTVSNESAMSTLAATKTLYISPTGSDSAAGTADQPLETIEQARDTIRAYKTENNGMLPSGGLTVCLMDGNYSIFDSVDFTSDDSGTADCPITYQALNKGKAHLLGGVQLGDSSFKKVTDPSVLSRLAPSAKDSIVAYQLPSDYQLDPMPTLPYGVSTTLPEALYVNDTPQILARWPNYPSYATVGSGSMITQIGTSDSSNITIQYSGDEISRLAGHTKDVIVEGYWVADWALEGVHIGTIDTVNKTFTPTESISAWNGSLQKNARYFIYNSLEELDQPGEWYLDRDTKTVYLYPTVSMSSDPTIYLSRAKDPMLQLNGASYLTFSGLDVEASRGSGVDMESCDNVLVAGSTFCNLDNTAVAINGCTNCGVQSCDMHSLGAKGISIYSGTNSTLTPQNNYAVNNNIYDYAQIQKNYNPAIEVFGVGNLVAHNEMHDAPHCAMLFGGNNNVIEYNNIYNVVQNSSDAGAIYAGRDFTQQGTVIRYNFIHDITPGAGISGGTIGVYLDDMLSGINVYGNVFSNVDFVAHYGGGWSNKFNSNILVGTSSMKTSLNIDDRGIGTDTDWFKDSRITLISRLQSSPYTTDAWKTAFPDLYTLASRFDLVDNPPDDISNSIWAPMYNQVKNNVLINGAPQPSIAQSARDNVKQAGDIDATTATMDDPGFASASGLDYTKAVQAVDDSGKLGDVKIDFSKIGCYTDAYRTEPVYRDGVYQKLGYSTSNVLTDGSDWQSADTGAVSLNNGLLTLKSASGSGENSGMLTCMTQQPTNDISVIKAKMNLENGSVSILLKSSDVNQAPGTGANAYVAVFSKDTIEIQKWLGTTKTIIASVPNTYIYNDAWQTIVFGAPNLSNSAEVMLKVDGNTVLDYNDITTPILDSGYFSVYNTSGANFSIASDSYNETQRKDVNLATFIADQNNWSYETGSTTINSSKGILSFLPVSDPTIAYTGAMTRNSVLHFRIKCDMQSSDGFYIGLNVKNPRELFWASPLDNTGYMVFVKSTQVELHRYLPGHEQILTVPTTVFAHDANSTTDNWHDVEVGTVSTNETVKIILNVDGKSLINYDDVNTPYHGDGYFQLASFNSAPIQLAGAVQISSVSVTAKTSSLYPKQALALNVSGKMSDGSNADMSKASIVYSIDNTGVATVDKDGVVTAVAPGKATISAIVTIGDFQQTGTFQVNVANKPTLSSVSVTANSDSLYPKQTLALSVSGKMSDGSNADMSKASIVYSIDNTDVATVDKDGIVTAIAAGKATITAAVTIDGVQKIGTFQVSVSVKQKKLSSISMKSLPRKTFYKKGEALNLKGAVITAVYDDGTQADLPVAASMVSGFSSRRNGTQKLTVTYDSQSTTFVVTVDTIAPSFGEPMYSETGCTRNQLEVIVPVKGATVYSVSWIFTRNGSHTFTVQDDAGNKAQKTVSVNWIDRTKPVIRTTVKGGSVKVLVSDAHLKSKAAKLNGKRIAWGSGVFTKKGKYTIVAVDKAGNQTATQFTITTQKHK